MTQWIAYTWIATVALLFSGCLGGDAPSSGDSTVSTVGADGEDAAATLLRATALSVDSASDDGAAKADGVTEKATGEEKAKDEKKEKDKDSIPAPSYTVERTCIAVDMGDGPMTVVGTLMEPASRPSTLLLLLPGTDITRAIFDAAPLGGESMQRHLASQGVASLAIDRPGMGESIHEAGITLEQSGLAVEQVLAAARAGTWTFGTECKTAGTDLTYSQIVVGGHSLGGSLALHYATGHTDMDGILLLGTPITTINTKTAGMLVFCALIHRDLATGRAPLFCPEAMEPLATCTYVLAYEATADVAATSTACEAAYAEPEGLLGEEDAQILPANRLGIADIPAIPAHLVFYEFDWAVSNPGSEAADREADLQEMEACCTVTSFVVEQTGHGWPLHPNQEAGYQSIVAWMEANF